MAPKTTLECPHEGPSVTLAGQKRGWEESRGEGDGGSGGSVESSKRARGGAGDKLDFVECTIRKNNFRCPPMLELEEPKGPKCAATLSHRRAT